LGKKWDLTVSLLRGGACPESGLARLIVSVDVRARACVLEVRVVLNTARRAGLRGAVLARAAVLRVGLVAVKVRTAGRLEV
jgi:hypothetical protein